MPKLGYKQTKEHRNKVGRKKGHKLSDETKNKLSINHTGKFSGATGKHWKVKDTSRMGKSRIGIKRPPFSKEWRENISKASKLSATYRKPMSEEQKRKLSILRKGKCYFHPSEEQKNKIREYQINNPNKKFKNTGIELKIENELIKRNINYEKQVPLCKIALVDFYLPEYRIVIQCDGCYYHNCPIHHPTHNIGRRDRDESQDKVLTFNGFNVYRFWEHEINESAEKCIDKIEIWGIDFNKD